MSGVPIDEEYPTKFDRLLCGGIWCIIRLEYDSNSDYDSGIISADGDHLRSKKKNQNDTPIKIINLNPIQMPHVDINERCDLVVCSICRDEYEGLILL